jgi:cysteinyl-tRNA synthetase
VLRLYDTRLRSVVDISAANGKDLTIYACGPTVYRFAHVGNLRTFLLTDLITRAAALEGLGVRLVQNITDVGHMLDDTGLGGAGEADEGQGDTEDKVLSQAASENKSALEIAVFYEDAFHQDLARLNITPAQVYPRASQSIDLMLDLIQKLLDSGNAYVGNDGSVFFSAQSCVDYGAISGNRLDALRPGYRFDGDPDPNKKFHADWALWKSAPETRSQLVWDTPWGRGFPGWHTECSAMSLHHLGDIIDVHTGGIDLRFPHHEDERAQSNSVAGHDVVKHWVHAEHLLFEGRKMSKSTGNVVLLEDVIARGIDPLALRLAFMSLRYRTQLDLTWSSISAADSTLRRWREKAQIFDPTVEVPAEQMASFKAAVLDDLDTPRALQVVRDLEKDSTISDLQTAAFLRWADAFLGLDLERAVEVVQIPQEVEQLLIDRATARANKEWQLSDQIRDQITELGWSIKDSADGQTAEPIR